MTCFARGLVHIHRLMGLAASKQSDSSLDQYCIPGCVDSAEIRISGFDVQVGQTICTHLYALLIQGRSHGSLEPSKSSLNDCFSTSMFEV